MEIISDLWWLWLLLFVLSSAYVLWERRSRGEVRSQFIITGTLLIIFYCVCFMSGVCTILNFLWRWVF